MPCKNNLRQVALEKTITATCWSTKIPINLMHTICPGLGPQNIKALCAWTPCHTCHSQLEPHQALLSQGLPYLEACPSSSHTQCTRDFFCDKNHSYLIFEDLNTVRYSVFLCVHTRTHKDLYINRCTQSPINWMIIMALV